MNEEVNLREPHAPKTLPPQQPQQPQQTPEQPVGPEKE